MGLRHTMGVSLTAGDRHLGILSDLSGTSVFDMWNQSFAEAGINKISIVCLYFSLFQVFHSAWTAFKAICLWKLEIKFNFGGQVFVLSGYKRIKANNLSY